MKDIKGYLYMFYVLVLFKESALFSSQQDLQNINSKGEDTPLKWKQRNCTIKTETREIYVDCSNLSLTRVPRCADLAINCSKIRHLNLRKNQLKEIEEGSFANFTGLTTLDISFNPFSHLENNSFKGLISLHTLTAENIGPWHKRWLKVDFCKIEVDVFKTMPLLESIDFTHSLLDIKSFLPSTCGLPQQINIFNLNNAFHHGPLILTNVRTQCLKEKSIKIFKFDRNYLILLETSGLLNLRHFEYLSFKKNRIQIARNEVLLLAAFHDLSFLDLTCQIRLTCLNQHSSLLSQVNLARAQSETAVYRPKEDNYRSKSDRNFQIKLIFLGKLVSLHLSQAGLKLDYVSFYQYNVCWVNNLSELDISYSRVYSVIGTFHCMDKLKKLNIRQIHSGYLDPRVFHEMPSLEVLQMGGSAPASTFDSNTSYLLFMNSRKLKFLDLSENGISNMNFSVLSPLKLLTAIDLNGNKISNPSFLPLTSLRYIMLSKNRLKQIPIKIIKHLEILSHQKLDTLLDISDNMFLCSCSMIGDLEMIQNTTVKITNKQSLMCTTATGKELKFKEALTSLKKTCRKGDSTSIIFLTGIYPFSLLVIVTVAVLLRYRWTVRHAWYTIYLLQERESAENKDASKCAFDAFVCYCCKDHKFVFNQLIPILEGDENPYRLCIHDRNFRPGAYIAENILAAIESSRITIMVVSKSFVRSKWCEFEVNAAQHHHLRGRNKNIIAVVLPSYKKNQVSHFHSLQNMLETVTYIPWPNDKEEQNFVWIKLRKAMGKPTSIEQNAPCFLLT